jgi:hypothetical protein
MQLTARWMTPSVRSSALHMVRVIADVRSRSTMAARKVTPNPFVGSWRIVEMAQWDQAFVDLEGPGFGTKPAIASCWRCARDIDASSASADQVCVHFSWARRQADPAAGRGQAVIRNGELFGHLYFHRGMDSSFRAIPKSRSNSAMDSDTVRSPLRAPHGARHRGR